MLEESIIELIDEAGQRHGFLLRDVFDLEEGTYYLVERPEDSDQVLLLRETELGLETLELEELDGVLEQIRSAEGEPD